ncbi:OadG family protein [Desulfosarcina sp. OttesenSCG-928-B08]|nr:OadG family protein [Desulfosarcina sp. OttesenSCG-928-B08]
MYGLEAIQQGNGWVMAGLGATIVLTGLAVLSFLVSQIHRIVGLFEARKRRTEASPQSEAKPRAMAPEQMPDDIGEACVLCQDLTQELGATFDLAELHHQCKTAGVRDPHFWVSRFRDAGLIVSAGECLFSWKTPSA